MTLKMGHSYHPATSAEQKLQMTVTGKSVNNYDVYIARYTSTHTAERILHGLKSFITNSRTICTTKTNDWGARRWSGKVAKNDGGSRG